MRYSKRLLLVMLVFVFSSAQVSIPSIATTHAQASEDPPLRELQASADTCRAANIVIENTGTDRALPVLILHDSNPSNEPIQVFCSQDLEPGESLTYSGSMVPPEGWTAKLYSFRQDHVCDVYDCPPDLTIDDIVGDLLCETLFFLEDPDEHMEFDRAYRERETFATMDLSLAYGSELDIHQRSDTCAKQFIPLAARNR